MKRRWGWVAIIAALAAAFFVFRHHRSPVGKLETSYWFWNTPFELSQLEIDGLHKLSVKELFVRSGTFSSDGHNLVLIVPQKYGDRCQEFPIHLVFNADAGVLHHFEDYDTPTIAEQIASNIESQIDIATRSKAKVVGVQLDFDIPTRLLPKYANLIQVIRKSHPRMFQDKSFSFSVTGLLSWLGTRGVVRLSDQVDFMIPQAYEGETGAHPDLVKPIFDPADARKRLAKIDELHCPYWVGIPAYGHALLYDQNDGLLGTYRQLEAQNALRHPSFRLEDAYPSDSKGQPAYNNNDWSGEEILKFKAIKAAPNGDGLGYSLTYTIPSADLPMRARQVVQESCDANCRGVVIYRVPEKGSSFTIPLDQAYRSLSGRRSDRLALNVSVKGINEPFGTLDVESKDIPVDAYVTVTNVGEASTFVSPDAMDVRLEFNKAGFESVRERDFDLVAFCHSMAPGDDVESRPREANVLHLRKYFSYPGQKLICGPIRLLNSSPLCVTIKSRLRHQSGLSYQDAHYPQAVIRSGTGDLP